MTDEVDLQEENNRLKLELQDLQKKRQREAENHEAKVADERSHGQKSNEMIQHKHQELESLRSRMVKLTRQLDEEVSRRDQAQAESQLLERRVQELSEQSGGSNLSARTKSGDTPFNIVTKNKRYDLMEFLHLYGVKVGSFDAEGKTALHIAAANDDVDAICRLLEWGADVNLCDKKRRTPLHYAAAGGHMKVTLLLLEFGADLNAKDDMEYTPVAHAESNNHFGLMDRLVHIGGKGHGLSQKGAVMATSKSSKELGGLNVSAQMLKSSSLGRIGKVKCSGLPGQLVPASAEKHH